MAIPGATMAGQQAGKRDILTVSDLNRKAKQLLETHFSTVWVQGELSNLARPQSGHWYFTLKDDRAQLRCAMFRNRNQLLRYRPREGDEIIVRGRLSLYEGRGDYQLVAAFLEPAGEGALRLAFERLKMRLADEGLFAAEAKLPVPEQPAEVAVISSPSGAAVRDILTVLQRRSPATAVTLLPVTVQGSAAAGQIVQALQLANSDNVAADVIILARGGGSLEDLWPFNEETVARAIHASRIPVVSAVGHETDFSISDLVADLRAPTPSAAAELLSRDSSELLAMLEAVRARMTRQLSQRIAGDRQALQKLSRRVRHPQRRLEELAQRGDDFAARIRQAMQRKLYVCRQEALHAGARLEARSPAAVISQAQLQVKHAADALHHLMQAKLESRAALLKNRAAVLEAISPLATLGRGYAIVRDACGRIIRDCRDAPAGSDITARLARGEMTCVVKSTIDD